ncbi:multiple coagulation factor deficiency protein 2 homolog [Amphiura filiformis]|uniref:multiple coagulation factor deficiency protein 2 homolog n=1 Tax=Amphiura filiformis TaxID=82378 RepID=UPI003B228A3D
MKSSSQYWIILLYVILATCLAVVLSHYSNPPSSDYSDKSKFHDPGVVRNKEHVQEHLEEERGKKDEEDMTDEELEFHYFKLHDFDNNTKLDGLEILAAISHVLPYEPENKDGKTEDDLQLEALTYYTDMIDQVLSDDDFNGDGYLTYLEYVLARRRAGEDIAKDQEL